MCASDYVRKSVSAERGRKWYGCDGSGTAGGSLTLPASFREGYTIKPGDTCEILDLDRIFGLMPLTPMMPELAREIARARVEAGLSVEDMLAPLRQQRERYVREKYGRSRR
jgi:bifunctional DNA-binding transcriptional regulator/antitoxin component of YhaV-PrlF toxin-antitoxin module